MASELLWNRSLFITSKGVIKKKCHYFINDNHDEVCGTKEDIEMLKADVLVSDKFKKKHLRVIDIDSVALKKYSEFMWITKDHGEEWKNLSCVDVMTTMKQMGNCVGRAGLYETALMLYDGGVCKLGVYPHGEHKKCDNNNVHNVLLAQLFNNAAAVCFKQERWEHSMVFSILGLKWNPEYEKCKQRLKVVKEKM